MRNSIRNRNFSLMYKANYFAQETFAYLKRDFSRVENKEKKNFCEKITKVQLLLVGFVHHVGKNV